MRKGLILVAMMSLNALPSIAQAPAANPLLLPAWDTPFGVPPFDRVEEDHFLPAFQEAIARHDGEVDAISAAAAAPTFANTIEALEASGELLARTNWVFGAFTSAQTTEHLQAINKQVAPMLSAHQDDIVLDARLFQRVKSIWDARESLSLDAEQKMLLERTWKRFVRGGAQLDAAGKERLRAINSELSSLTVRFGDNVLKETNAYRLVIENPADLAGLPDRVRASGAEAAKKAGLEGQWLFTLHAPSLWPFLQYADRRELRRQIFTAYITRGDHGDELDNKSVLSRIAALRVERARLLGYRTHADYVLEENMAKTPARVDELLGRLWTPALARARAQAAEFQAALAADQPGSKLEPWDWFYYAEKARKARFDLDESALRPYFELGRVREGAFWVANKLYGVTVAPLEGMPVYHPEMKAYEVKDADGSHLAVFYTDFHPRPGKRSGAWSTRYRDSWVKDGQPIRPVVANVCNFSRPAGDSPALLSLDEVETLFHEFGHGLHSILSQVRYRTLAAVPRDFVELPSQIMENWAREPEVLKVYARHWQTGASIPDSLVRKIEAARQFDQPFATLEYLAASLLDMSWHTLAEPKELDATAFEQQAMAKIDLPSEIVPRYRSPYFQHVFSGGYSAGYYSYIWSEVLDADAFQAFKEKGLFDPATAKAFRTAILERGGTDEAMALYVRFRGREPSVDPLLERRGLKDEVPPANPRLRPPGE